MPLPLCLTSYLLGLAITDYIISQIIGREGPKDFYHRRTGFVCHQNMFWNIIDSFQALYHPGELLLTVLLGSLSAPLNDLVYSVR